jgi:hypothetical protein
LRIFGVNEKPEREINQPPMIKLARIFKSAIRNPQSAIHFACSLLIHLFREKTGSKFSARSLESW